MKKEDWIKIDLPQVKKNYSINFDGFIRNDKFNRILKNSKNTKGYEYIQLACIDGKFRNFLIHRLLAYYFMPDFDIFDKSMIIHHKDSINKFNKLDLLEKCTQKENIAYSYKEGNKPIGEKHPLSKFSDKLSKQIVSLLQENKSTDIIIYELNLENKKNIRTFINDLRAKRTRIYLTENIDLNKCKQKRYDEELIRNIIKFMKQGLKHKKIIDKLGLNNLSKREIRNLYTLMSNIKSGRSWKKLYKGESSKTIEKYVIEINI